MYNLIGPQWANLRGEIEKAEKALASKLPAKKTLVKETGNLKERLHKVAVNNQEVLEWFEEFEPTLNRMFSPNEIHHLKEKLRIAK